MPLGLCFEKLLVCALGGCEYFVYDIRAFAFSLST